MAAPIFGQPTKPNPMLAHGAGPEGKTCRTCAEIAVNWYDKKYYKCQIRGVSASASTDHRLKWPACAYYRELVG